MDYSLRSVNTCWPSNQIKLLDDLVLNKDRRGIHAVWITSGHIFISLDEGRRLISLDGNIADYTRHSHQAEGLDIVVDSPILTVLSHLPSTFLVVQQNSRIQVWRYNQDYRWSDEGELCLCDNQSVISSVCYDANQSTIYWCQGHSTPNGQMIYSVHKRKVIEGDGSTKHFKLGSATTLVEQCTDCDLYPIAHGVSMVTRGCGQQFSLTLLLWTLKATIEVVIGWDRVTLPDLNTHSSVQLRQILMKCLPYLKQLQEEKTVLQSAFCHHSQTLWQLRNNGSLKSIHTMSEKRTSVKEVALDNFSGEDVCCLMKVSGGVAIVHKDNVKVYDVTSGSLLKTLDIPLTQMAQAGCVSLPGAHQHGFYTHTDVFLLQVQHDVPAQLGQLSVDVMKDKWLNHTTDPPSTKLHDILGPYLKEYKKFEDVKSESLNREEIPEVPLASLKEMVHELLDAGSPLTQSAKHSHLLLLSVWFPQQLLDVLLEHMETEDDESNVAMQRRHWVIKPESAGKPSKDVTSVSLFEITCHLLYKHQPSKLMGFLQQRQKIWEKGIGISAFVRRRQSPVMYERAVACLPEPRLSIDPDMACYAHAEILLASKVENCHITAVHLLLKYERWQEAVDLLRNCKDKVEQYNLLYQTVLSALTQKNVLAKYGPEIFPLMNQFNSLEGMSGNGCQVEPVCSEETDGVNVGAVRQYLSNCIKDL